MSNYAAFMADVAEKPEVKEVVVSKRFKKADGTPEVWKIRALTADEDSALQEKSVVDTASGRDLDRVKYTALWVAESVVYPNLNTAALQDSYGVKSAAALLTKMLYKAEYDKLAAEVQKMNRQTLPELVNDAKN